jgi:hypothetical protein
MAKRDASHIHLLPHIARQGWQDLPGDGVLNGGNAPRRAEFGQNLHYGRIHLHEPLLHQQHECGRREELGYRGEIETGGEGDRGVIGIRVLRAVRAVQQDVVIPGDEQRRGGKDAAHCVLHQGVDLREGGRSLGHREVVAYNRV